MSIRYSVNVIHVLKAENRFYAIRLHFLRERTFAREEIFVLFEHRHIYVCKHCWHKQPISCV